MKFNFKLSNIEVAGITIGGIEVSTDISMSEAIGMRKESEYMLEQLPVYLDQLAEGARKFMQIDDELSGRKSFEDEVNDLFGQETYDDLVARKTAERKQFFTDLDTAIKNKKQNKDVE